MSGNHAPLFLGDLIAIARTVKQRADSGPVARQAADEWFADLLRAHGHEPEPRMWETACGLLRAAIGPQEHDRYFKFPYPHLVGAALAIEGRSGDGSNMALDFMDQWEDDHPRGIGCSAHCAGTCEDDTGYCGCLCTGGCHYTKAIRAAYERAGSAAMWLEQFMLAVTDLTGEYVRSQLG